MHNDYIPLGELAYLHIRSQSFLLPLPLSALLPQSAPDHLLISRGFACGRRLDQGRATLYQQINLLRNSQLKVILGGGVLLKEVGHWRRE